MKKLHTYRHLMTAAMLILLFASCREEQSEDKLIGTQGGDIFFSLTSSVPSTRGMGQECKAHMLDCIESDTLYIRTSVEELSGTQTKGYCTTTENLSSFHVSAYLSTGEMYFENVQTTKGDDGFAHTGKYWPGRTLNFFAGSHHEDDLKFSVSNDGECNGSFSYTLPEPDTDIKKDAAAQPDYVFAIAADCINEKKAVELEFHHAFSAICFKIGSMDSENRVINHISLKNAVSSGDCTFGLNGDGITVFEWDNQSGSKTYTQTIDAAIDNGSLINNDGTIFMMVPHVLSDIEMEISFTLHKGTAYEHEYVICRKLADYTTEWLADKKYIYTVSSAGDVEVEITDQMTATVKSDVEITSQGSSTSYIRAAIVGYWVNTEGNIVGAWKDTDGEFDWGTDWGSHWVKHTDGFYYHLKELEQGEKTWPLFEKYTLTYENPITDAHLELHIATQAVIHHKVGEAWPGCPMDK